MVDVTVTSGTTAYTWNNTDYTWDSVPAEATWDDCYISGYTVIAEYEFIPSDDFSRDVTYVRELQEDIIVTESCGKDITKPFTENFKLYDYLVKSSSCVVFDLVLRSAANMDLQRLRTIAKRAQIAGYEDGSEFLPGDYEFREAIVGLTITNNSAKSKIGFKNIDMFVDTPDIKDRGLTEITNSGPNYDSSTGYTTIYFNKPYHHVPNVVAGVASGTELGDYIFDPQGFTKTYFRAKIVKKSNSSVATTGTLLWEAVGY